MSGSELSADRVLVDIDGQAATFALTSSSGAGTLQSIRRYRTADFPTATDCVMNFAREAGIDLAGSDCAVAVSGALSGDSVRIARCPWIISRTGFGYIFRKPVYFLNDSAAMLWGATRVGHLTHRSHVGQGLPEFDKPGKWLGINYQTGLGAAVLIVLDNGGRVHLETEVGHVAFAPLGDVERKLSDNLAKVKTPVSWESALFADIGDPAWQGTAAEGHSSIVARHRAEIFGSFVGDAIMATGSWSGVLLFGAGAEVQNSREHAAAFAKRIEGRANFQPALRNVPRWTVSMPDLNLLGAASFLHAQLMS